MSIRLKNIVKELRVKIVYDEFLETDGHYIASINTILINSNLDEHTKMIVLLHELGHAAMHQDNYQLYRLTFTLHSKMENEAEEFMIKETLEGYLETGQMEPSQINYVHFLEMNEFDIKYESFIRELLTKKVIGI